MRLLVITSALALLLSSCNNNTPQNTTAAGSDTQGKPRREVSSQIAYIQLDTLMSRYDMFVEMSSALEAKATKAENELTSKGRSLERSVADAQDKIEKGLVTRAQAMELQEKLQRQEQSFYQQRETVQRELAEENQVMMNNIYHSLNSFLSEFNANYQYGVIMTTSGGAPILHADPALDITEMVVKGLNEKYAKEKSNN